MSLWRIWRDGFLPFHDPACQLHEDLPASQQVEKLAADLPALVAEGTIRQELVSRLSSISELEFFTFFDCLPGLQGYAERAMMLFSYFASSYIHAPGQPTATILPKEISLPLVRLSEIVGRPPILSYASYCLFNWERLEYDKPIELGNIKLLQNFTLDEGRRDENWFVLVHVDIEAKAGPGIAAISYMMDKWRGCPLDDPLAEVYSSLDAMYKTLCRMPEECSPDVYFSRVRPYIFSYENMVYEGWRPEPLTYRGETGAQSSVIPAFQIALGVQHKNSMLTEHLRDMRKYMPPEHRRWLANLENLGTDFRQYAIKFGEKELYNKCLGRLIDFRKKHLEYAIEYIQKKVDNPTGTGGTPYIRWLSQLVQETEEFYL